MKKIELSDNDEIEWLEYLENNKDQFLESLYEKLKSNRVKLKLSNKILTKIFFSKQIIDSYSEYPEYKYFLNKHESDILIKLSKYLDLSNLKYKNLFLDQDVIDILKEINVAINLDAIINDISGLRFESCIIDGSFDDHFIYFTQIISCKDSQGERVKINPQKVIDKNLTRIIAEGVTFTDSFDDCKIAGSVFENCNTSFDKRLLINPSKVKDQDLSYCKIDNAKFLSSFDNCNIMGINLIVNNRNIIINPQKIKGKNLSSAVLKNVSFTGSFNNCFMSNAIIKKCKNCHVVLRDKAQCSNFFPFSPRYIEMKIICTDEVKKYIEEIYPNYKFRFEKLCSEEAYESQNDFEKSIDNVLVRRKKKKFFDILKRR